MFAVCAICNGELHFRCVYLLVISIVEVGPQCYRFLIAPNVLRHGYAERFFMTVGAEESNRLTDTFVYHRV